GDRRADTVRLPRAARAALRRRRLPVAAERARPELGRSCAQSLRPRRAEPLLPAAGLAAVLGAGARLRARPARLPRGLAGAAPAERFFAWFAALPIANCKLQIANWDFSICNLQFTIYNSIACY